MKDAEEILFYFSDLKLLYQRKKGSILKFSLFFCLPVFILLLIRTPLYEAKATFRDTDEKKEKSELFLLPSPVKNQRTGAELMNSFQIFKEVIYRLGIQANVQGFSLLTELFQRIRDNLKIGLGYGIKDIERFHFRNVHYEGEEKKNYFLRFISQTRFEVFDHKKKFLYKSEIGRETKLQDISFTLVKIPEYLKQKKYYRMTICPWQPIASMLIKKVSVCPKIGNPDLLDLKFSHRDRFFANNVLNHVMTEYQNYLWRENEAFARSQFDYLEKRQIELADRFKEALDDHIHYIETNLGEHCFSGSDQDLSVLIVPYQSGMDKLSSIDFQLRRLQSFDPFLPALPEPIGSEYMRLHQNVQFLQSNRDQLDLIQIKEKGIVFQIQKKCQERLREINDQLNLSEKELKLWKVDDDLPVEAKQMMVHLHSLQEERENLLKELQPLETKLSVLQEIRNQKEEIEQQIKDLEGEASGVYEEVVSFCKDDLANQLNQTLHLLNVREKMLREEAFYGEEFPNSEGLDLETAKVLFVEYNNQRNASQIRSRQYETIVSQIKQEDCELSSLSSHLKDPISQELIHRTSQIKWNLEDEKNYSPKEEERLRKELALHRSVLSQHIEQMIGLADLEKDVLSEKLRLLQQSIRYLLAQKISIYQQQMEEYLASYRENLLHERELLSQKLERLKEQMNVLPQKWKKENELNLKKDLSLQMMKATVNLMEEKTILHNLKQLTSKPLDIALVPFLPKNNHLIFFLVMAFLLAIILSFSYQLIKSLMNGFELSMEALRAEHPFVAGKISSSCDGPYPDPLNDQNLETLRKMSQFLKIGSVVSLIGGTGPNYSHALAELMKKQDLNVLLIDASFSSKCSVKREESFLEVLEKKGKTLPIIKNNHYDFVPSGGYTRFANEYLSSASFSKLLGNVKKKYDVVLLFSRVLPSLTESKTYLSFSDQVIVTVERETINDLKSFISWAHPQDERLSFVMHS